MFDIHHYTVNGKEPNGKRGELEFDILYYS